jgi:hypothetical protein
MAGRAANPARAPSPAVTDHAAGHASRAAPGVARQPVAPLGCGQAGSLEATPSNYGVRRARPPDGAMPTPLTDTDKLRTDDRAHT